jgi:glycosyltransferase involved in cell wall biosynthesis
MKNVLFVVPYPEGRSPSQRFRFEQYLHLLHNSYNVTIRPFWSEAAWNVLYKKNGVASKILSLINGIIQRALLFITLRKYDFIFIHREAAPIGPPVWEWIAAKIFRKRIIYDFDDAIWLTDKTDESWLMNLIKWRSKVGSICRWSYRVSCGNKFLASYASRFSSNVILNPTTIDTENLHNPESHKRSNKLDDTVKIGWTGSNSTIKYLKLIEIPLQKIEKIFPTVRIIVIADKMPQLNLKSLHFIPWNLDSEIKDLTTIDIGIMPLPDDEWAKGKCGFKALQYMALKIPAVASAVGANSEIIHNGNDGILCTTSSDWEETLSTLIRDASLRKRIGENGRKNVVNNYSVSSNSDNFLSLFEV